MTTPLATAAYALALGDDALILAHRCGQWITHAPQLEEDVALANIGLDLLGQARTLLAYAGAADGRTEDDLAYLRDAPAFTNVRLVELANTDFALSMARLLAFSTYQFGLYSALTTSTDPQVAAMAAKAVKEVSYHADHAAEWTVRLGDGTDESHRRMQAGLDLIWPYLPELFDNSFVPGSLITAGVAVAPATLLDDWQGAIREVIARATLTEPEPESEPVAAGSGRRGEHGAELVDLLTQMQSVARAHPGAAW